MRILIVCGEYFNASNGLCLSTQRFVRELRRMGDEVRVLSSNRGGTPEYAVPVMRLPFVDGIMEQQNYHFAKPDAAVTRQALEWAEVVHIVDPFPLSMLAARLAARMGLPVTGAFHLYPENMTASVPILNFRLMNALIMRVFRRGVFRHCRAIQCPTERVKARLTKCGYHSNLRVISNGIPPEFIADAPKAACSARFTVISVGRYSNEKDQATLLRAIALSRHAADIQLILAGKGPLQKKYRALGQTLPNPPVMRFYAQSELRQVVRSADLYVHCAHVEVEGMACMEAFAQGTVPLIAVSALSSTAEYALTEQNTFRAGDAEALAGRIDYWFEHLDALRAMSGRYIALAGTLKTEASAARLRAMLLDAMRE